MLAGTELPEETRQGAQRPPWWSGEHREQLHCLLLGGTEFSSQERGSYWGGLIDREVRGSSMLFLDSFSSHLPLWVLGLYSRLPLTTLSWSSSPSLAYLKLSSFQPIVSGEHSSDLSASILSGWLFFILFYLYYSFYFYWIYWSDMNNCMVIAREKGRGGRCFFNFILSLWWNV